MFRIIKHLPPYIASIVTFLTICYVSLAPDPLPTQERLLLFPGADKVIHFAMYATLMVAFCFDYSRRLSHRLSERTGLTAAIVTAITTGGVIEIMQHSMQLGRSGDVVDFVADIAGVFIGLGIGAMLFPRQSDRNK